MDANTVPRPTLRLRSIVISGVHLGFKGCRAEITEIDGITYCNDGDWIESCTTLVEDFQGRLSLLCWTETVEVLVGDRALPLMEGVVALESAA